MYIKAERGLTRQLLLEDGDERVRGAKVHVGDGLEDVASGDLLAGAVDGLVVRAGVSGSREGVGQGDDLRDGSRPNVSRRTGQQRVDGLGVLSHLERLRPWQDGGRN